MCIDPTTQQTALEFECMLVELKLGVSTLPLKLLLKVRPVRITDRK